MNWRFSLFAVWLVACSHMSKSEIRTTSDSTANSASQGSTVVETHRVDGPETVRTVIEEFAPPDKTRAEGRGALETAYPPSAAVRPQDLPDSNRATHESQITVPDHGPLVKRTVITDVRGPSSMDSLLHANTASQTHAASETHSDTKQASKTRWGPGPFAWLGIACGLGLVIALVIRFKLWRAVL